MAVNLRRYLKKLTGAERLVLEEASTELRSLRKEDKRAAKGDGSHSMTDAQYLLACDRVLSMIRPLLNGRIYHDILEENARAGLCWTHYLHLAHFDIKFLKKP